MDKIKEAQQILRDLGLPKQQQNKLSALTLLALAGLKPKDKWASSSNRSLTLTKDILDFVNTNYAQNYKQNTRESFRKNALRPFVNFNIALLNPDNPELKQNSQNTHYALSDIALATLKKFQTEEWGNATELFKNYISAQNRLEIKNFKSIKNIKLEFSRINVFIGKPNSGKSNLLEALTLFNFIEGKKSKDTGLIRFHTLDNLFYDRNIVNNIEVNLKGNTALFTYKSGITTFLHLVNPSKDFLDNQKIIFYKPLSLNEILNQIRFLSEGMTIDGFSSKFEVLGNDGNFSQRNETTNQENPIHRYEFKDGGNYSDSFSGYLKTYGENLFTIVQSNDKIREWINAFYEAYHLEFLIDFSSRMFEVQKKEKGIVYKIPFELTPDTFRRMLFHVAAIYSNKNATILFEEPESHSFPPYVNELSELIKADKNNNTFFITTHSPYFFNSMLQDSKKVKGISFFHVYYEDFQTKVRKLTNKDLDNIWDSGADIFFNIDSFVK